MSSRPIKRRLRSDSESSILSSSEDDCPNKRVTRFRSRDSPSSSHTDFNLNFLKTGTKEFNYKLAGMRRPYDSSSDEDVRRKRRNSRDSSEERATPIRDLNKCCLPGCNSIGNINGVDDTHCTLSACPIFHNETILDCKEKHEKRMIVAEELKPLITECENKRSMRNPLISSDQKMRKDDTDKKRDTLSDITSSISILDRAMWRKHERINGKFREPLLKGLACEYDIAMFREAQVTASSFIGHSDDYLVLAENASFNISELVIGEFIMDTWYTSPYPEEYTHIQTIYVCEFCLKYMRTAKVNERHVLKCSWRHPPGDEIYRKSSISVFEIDGKKQKVYCQNLCLMAKLFLDHKTLYYNVEPFLFYVFTENDGDGCHIVGYFSKEKQSFNNYNVSCLLTLPPHMRKGYGRMFIGFSYLLSKLEGKLGSPERPLSDLGLVSYRSYWKYVLLKYLSEYEGKNLSIKDISSKTGVHSNDIVSTLQYLGMLKYWKGHHVVIKRQDLIEEQRISLEKINSKYKCKIIDSNALRWQATINNK